MIFKCPYCNNTFFRLNSHVYKCQNLPNNITKQQIDKDCIELNYNLSIYDVLNDYNNYYSLPMLQQKYNIPYKKIYNILDICNQKHRTIQEGVKYIAIPKIQAQCLEKYGVLNYTQTDDFKNKSINTCLKKYGVDNVSKLDNIKMKKIKTCLENFNVNFPFQSNLIKEKSRQTCLKKYGVEHVSKLISHIQKSHSISANNKRSLTFKKNNTYNKSKDEDICFELLKQKYSDCIRQYKSELYPFNCDFYIPSLDLYIEYNGSHYHHYHPFNENNEYDLNELNNLKEKANNSNAHKNGKKSQYDNIIYTWTILDLKKRNIAQQNNLNYIEFWNINEVKEWINKQ